MLWAGRAAWAQETPARALENEEKRLEVGKEAPKWGVCIRKQPPRASSSHRGFTFAHTSGQCIVIRACRDVHQQC